MLTSVVSPGIMSSTVVPTDIRIPLGIVCTIATIVRTVSIRSFAARAATGMPVTIPSNSEHNQESNCKCYQLLCHRLSSEWSYGARRAHR